MLEQPIETALNNQIEMEAVSAHVYLAMASWAENKGLGGTAEFLYRHSDEERQHMLKLIHFVNERGGRAVIPALSTPNMEFTDVQGIFRLLLDHEQKVTASINEVVHLCLQHKDYTTHNFIQWYVAEQIEEEALARLIIDKLNLIGADKAGLYLFDRDLQQLGSAAPDKSSTV